MPDRELVGRLKRRPPKPKRKAPAGKKICGAQTRSKTPCQCTFLCANGRCRMHGGTNRGNPKPNKESVRKSRTQYGIYADVGLLDDEYPVYEGIQGKIGTLDEELHMARVKLRRAYKAQHDLENAKDELAAAADDKEKFIRVAISHKLLSIDTLEDKTDSMAMGNKDDRYLEDIAKSSMIRRIRDYSDDIHRFTRLIKKLEQARKELLETEDWGDDFIRKLAEDLRLFFEKANVTIPSSGLGSGCYPELREHAVTQ